MLEEWEDWRERRLPENQGLSHPMKGSKPDAVFLFFFGGD